MPNIILISKDWQLKWYDELLLLEPPVWLLCFDNYTKGNAFTNDKRTFLVPEGLDTIGHICEYLKDLFEDSLNNEKLNFVVNDTLHDIRSLFVYTLVNFYNFDAIFCQHGENSLIGNQFDYDIGWHRNNHNSGKSRIYNLIGNNNWLVEFFRSAISEEFALRFVLSLKYELYSKILVTNKPSELYISNLRKIPKVYRIKSRLLSFQIQEYSNVHSMNKKLCIVFTSGISRSNAKSHVKFREYRIIEKFASEMISLGYEIKLKVKPGEETAIGSYFKEFTILKEVETLEWNTVHCVLLPIDSSLTIELAQLIGFVNIRVYNTWEGLGLIGQYIVDNGMYCSVESLSKTTKSHKDSPFSELFFAQELHATELLSNLFSNDE